MFGWFRKKEASDRDDMNPAKATDHFRRGEYDEALRRAEVMLAAGPQIGLSWRFKGECLFQMERYAEAEECFRKAHQIGGPGTDEVLFWAAFCSHNRGEHAGAEATLLEYIQTLPADAHERRRQADRALRAFRGQPEE